MSEESIKITGVTQVIKLMLIGLVYFVILYVIVLATQTQLINNSVIPASAKIMLVAGVLFLSILSGMLVRDFSKKFSIINLTLLFLITAIDLIPIKLFIQAML